MSGEGWILVLAGLFVLWLAFKLFVWALRGALHLLALASDQGFIGLAVYIACWVFFFPVMLAIAIIVGVVARSAEKDDERARQEQYRLEYHD